MNKKLRNINGFTLLELMAVVSIISILSAIAIPNYNRIRLAAKTSEAKVNLGSIRTCEESYKSENETYVGCNVCPDDIPDGTGPKVSFTGMGLSDFDRIGFTTAGEVYYRYSVISTDIDNFLGIAEGDLDGDGLYGEFHIDNNSKKIINMAELYF